jgi:hypothetical protein
VGVEGHGKPDGIQRFLLQRCRVQHKQAALEGEELEKEERDEEKREYCVAAHTLSLVSL